jgi:hypothetical protein
LPRHNNRSVLRIRYRNPGKTFSTRFVPATSVREDDSKGKGRILRVTKVGYEEALRVGEFCPKSVLEANRPIPIRQPYGLQPNVN